jgi:hypothetical protein
MARRSTGIDPNARRARARRTALIAGAVALAIYVGAIIEVMLQR